MSDPLVHLVDHPLVQHLLTDLRDRGTPPLRFRQVMETLGTLLCYEAIRRVELVDAEVTTPLETMQAPRLAHKVTLVPILRAGLGLDQRDDAAACPTRRSDTSACSATSRSSAR